MHLAFLLRTALILCFIMVNAKEASLPLCLKKKKKILFWLLKYLLLLFIPCLDIFISIIVFGTVNQKLESKETEFPWSRFMIQYEKLLYFEMQSPKSRRIWCQNVFKSFPRGDLMQVPGDCKVPTNGVKFQVNLHWYQGVLGDLTIISFKLLYRLSSCFIPNANTTTKHGTII